MGQHSRFLIKEYPCTQQKGTPGLNFICCLLQSAFTRANITCEMYLTDFEQKASGDLSYEMVGFSYITWVFVYPETDMLCIHTTKMKKKKISILKVDNTIQSTKIQCGLFRFHVNSNKFTIKPELTLHEHFKVVISIPQLKLSFVKLDSRVFPS